MNVTPSTATTNATPTSITTSPIPPPPTLGQQLLTHFWKLFALLALGLAVWLGYRLFEHLELIQRWGFKISITQPDSYPVIRDNFLTPRSSLKVDLDVVSLKTGENVRGVILFAERDYLFMNLSDDAPVDHGVAIPVDNIKMISVTWKPKAKN